MRQGHRPPFRATTLPLRHNETRISGDPSADGARASAGGVTMRSDVAPAARAVVGLAFLLGGPALAQDASLDRANLEAAAGRRVFENVLLADPQAFARRTPVRTRDQARPWRLQLPRARVTLRRSRSLRPCRRPRGLPQSRGRSRSATDEANRGSTGKREAVGARGIGLALRPVTRHLRQLLHVSATAHRHQPV